MAVRPITIAPQMMVGTIAPFEGFEGGSQAFGVGAALVVNTNELDEGVADLTVGLVGFAADAAGGVQAAALGYYPALGGVVFEGNLSTGGANPPTAHVLLVTDFFERFALQIDTSQTPDVWYIDQGDVVNNSVTIIGFRDPPGTSDARVYFVVHADVSLYAS